MHLRGFETERSFLGCSIRGERRGRVLVVGWRLRRDLGRMRGRGLERVGRRMLGLRLGGFDGLLRRTRGVRLS